jgi:hypothetical protein
MPILHLRLTEANQNIVISKELKAQQLTLVRTTITKDTTAGATNAGSLFFELEFFNGFEYISNLNDNYLVSPIDDALAFQTYQLSQSFFSEDVKTAFNVKVRKYDGTNYSNVLFGAGNGHIKTIDMFFQVSSLTDFQTY